jgi:hypothetical protein
VGHSDLLAEFANVTRKLSGFRAEMVRITLFAPKRAGIPVDFDMLSWSKNSLSWSENYFLRGEADLTIAPAS